jgi:hypothetical protein
VCASYVLREVQQSDSRDAIIRSLWAHTTGVLVIVEPGTPVGFERVRLARELLIKTAGDDFQLASCSIAIATSFQPAGSSGRVIAPCTHDLPCPMTAGKWCHFKQRLQRPSSLTAAKPHTTLDWQDEPFSFVAFGRHDVGKVQQPAQPLLESQSAQAEEWGWGRVLWPTIHVRHSCQPQPPHHCTNFTQLHLISQPSARVT